MSLFGVLSFKFSWPLCAFCTKCLCGSLYCFLFAPSTLCSFLLIGLLLSSKIRKAKTASVITVDNGILALWPLAFTFVASPDREFLLVGLYVAIQSTDAVSVTSVIRNSSLASVV